MVTPTTELPPRARRIPGTRFNASPLVGTTSACAENTGGPRFCDSSSGNYLRVRGEYEIFEAWAKQRLELPPRARRILTILPSRGTVMGTTSACAENTGGEPFR